MGRGSKSLNTSHTLIPQGKKTLASSLFFLKKSKYLYLPLAIDILPVEEATMGVWVHVVPCCCSSEGRTA